MALVGAGDRYVLSVVIPTRNRKPSLAGTLEALDRQVGLRGPFEVVVADDGSTDGTHELVQAGRSSRSYPIQYLRLPAAGPATARNRAIEVARAPRVLLLGDDTAPEPGTLAAHLSAGEGEVGVQGQIDWDPERPITAVMRFLAPAGPQFYFANLVEGEALPYTAVLGSNLSAPTAWFREEPFDEGFSAAAFEDTELAYRWARHRWTVVYSRRARCLHRHAYETLEPFLERQARAGRAARYAIRRHPSMAWRVVAIPFAFGCFCAVCYLARRVLGTARPEHRWDLEARATFLQGLFTAER